MEYSSTLIGIAILLIFIVPIVWMINNSKRKAKKQKELVTNLCKKNAMLVKNPTQVGNALLGIDLQNKKLFHTNIKNIEEDFQVISTENITQLKVVEETYPMKKNILQVFIAINANEYLLSVYNDKDMQLVVTDPKTCAHEARQWVEQVKSQLI